MSSSEPEWRTRKQRIDPRLDVRGWSRNVQASPITRAYRTEEEATAAGPADYALWLDGHIAGVVEAKKLTVGPQNLMARVHRVASDDAKAKHTTKTRRPRANGTTRASPRA